MKLALSFCLAFIVAALVFAVYFCSVAHLFPLGRSLAEFSAMFQPLEAFSTALAFIAIVIIAWTQSKELRQTKRDTAEAFVRASRLQASGARLISMATQNDPNLEKARRELEQQVEELEQWFKAYLREQA